jgi:tRNA A37 threonylcarbamoyladenosine biosynthesis protein TsaE
MDNFLLSEDCPNFIKADVERARKHQHIENEDEEDVLDESIDQPEWMEAIRPNAEYDHIYSDFKYDDGGPEYDWSKQSHDYPEDMGLTFVERLNDLTKQNDNFIDIPDIQLDNMNEEQQFAFNIIMSTLLSSIKKEKGFHPLRLIVAGTAGSGKSYLIKCLVKAIRTLFKSNKAAQIVCPTGNSANIISGMTLHSFLKIPTNSKGKEMKAPDGSLGIAEHNRHFWWMNVP